MEARSAAIHQRRIRGRIWSVRQLLSISPTQLLMTGYGIAALEHDH